MTAIRDLEVMRLTGDGARAGEPDRVAVEEPLEIRINGHSATVTMRTPGHDEELARGFLYGEGLIGRPGEAGKRQVISTRRPDGLRPGEVDNVIDLELSEALAVLRLDRNFYATSSCGVCGKSSLAALEVHAAPIVSALRVPAAVLAALPDRLREGQLIFEATGGLHAAGVFSAAGDLLCLREDVGRHNAVDKTSGWAHASGALPLSDAVLCVSGRTSFEILQKAVMAGVPIVAAVSAPSSLAVELASRFGVTLCGFVRGGGFSIYTHPARIV
jgi:FdhD protein